MRTILGIILATTAVQAFAITTNAVPAPIPEPGALSLLGIGAVAGLLIRAKQRNKKK